MNPPLPVFVYDRVICYGTENLTCTHELLDSETGFTRPWELDLREIMALKMAS